MKGCIGGGLLLFCHYQNKIMSSTFESTTIFDNCVNELELSGYALLSIPTLYQNNDCERRRISIANAFATARCALNDISSSNTEKMPIIDPSTDSGSWTGYHNAAVVNGRYNQYREGFVFSNGEMFNVDTTNNNNNNFENDMNNLFRIMHDDIANGVLRAIERRLELPNQYFDQEFGPTDTSSQWHLKRYVLDDSIKKDHSLDGDEKKKQNEVVDVVLPVHTDPSLISVVIVDQVGSSNGGMGLEVYHQSEQKDEDGTYKEISQSGHDVAIIFVGSVLSYLTKGQIFSAAKHRVVNWTSNTSTDDKGRMAATLFVRPNGDSVMTPLPSAYLQSNESKKKPPTFSVWNSRVAKNYMKKKQQQKG